MAAERFVADPATGLLHPARYQPSPNCNPRPPSSPIDTIIIHAISLPPGEIGGGWIDRLFTNTLQPEDHPAFRAIAPLRVSSHLLIDFQGEVTQYVPFYLRAWHAGRSSFRGRPECNDYAIGIELEGDGQRAYADCQYTQLAHVIDALRATYRAITPDRIVGHSDVAPERKTDPGPAFEWARLYACLVGSSP